MTLLGEADWARVDALRTRVMNRASDTVAAAAQAFVEDLAASFSSVVLARLFAVLPLASLPPSEHAFATSAAAARAGAPLSSSTRVLSLLGTHGRRAIWCQRANSKQHLAIPLLDRSSVQDAPMIARVLSELDVDLAALDDGRPIASRLMLGGRNAMFFIPDAQAAVDERGRAVIPSRDFVTENDVRAVFGMGGAYMDGTLVVTIVFTSESLARMAADRFASLIGNFKIATSTQLAEGRIYP